MSTPPPDSGGAAAGRLEPMPVQPAPGTWLDDDHRSPIVFPPSPARLRRGSDRPAGNYARVVARTSIPRCLGCRTAAQRRLWAGTKEEAMARKQIVILGGGTGGTTVANRLHRHYGADEAQIHVVDGDDHHLYQPGLLFVPFGGARLEELVRSRRRQLRHGVSFHEQLVDEVLLDRSQVLLADGTRLPYDVSSSRPARACNRRRRLASPAPAGTSGSSASTTPRAPRRSTARSRASTAAGSSSTSSTCRSSARSRRSSSRSSLTSFSASAASRGRTELVYATPLDGAFTKPVASAHLASLLNGEGHRAGDGVQHR